MENIIQEYQDLDMEPTAVENLFSSEEDAIYSLYEELFLGARTVCKKTIFDAMQYLAHSKHMYEQIEDFKNMDPSSAVVMHENEINNYADQIAKDLYSKED